MSLSVDDGIFTQDEDFGLGGLYDILLSQRREAVHMIQKEKERRQEILKREKRLIRIELTLEAWKASVLPLNYRRKKDDICIAQTFFLCKVTVDFRGVLFHPL